MKCKENAPARMWQWLTLALASCSLFNGWTRHTFKSTSLRTQTPCVPCTSQVWLCSPPRVAPTHGPSGNYSCPSSIATAREWEHFWRFTFCPWSPSSVGSWRQLLVSTHSAATLAQHPPQSSSAQVCSCPKRLSSGSSTRTLRREA